MSALPGDQPDRQRNFHGTRGEHLFPHPSSYEPRRSAWSAWERRYAAHLDRHKELAENPEPMDGDGETVKALFAHIEHLRAIIKKEQQLVVALRQRAAEHPEADELELNLPGLPGRDRRTMQMAVAADLGDPLGGLLDDDLDGGH